MLRIPDIRRLLIASALLCVPGVGAAQSVDLGTLSISSWNICDKLCGTTANGNESDSGRRVKAKDVLRAVVDDMVEAQVTLNFRRNSVRLLQEKPDVLRYRVRLGLAYQGAQIGFKSTNDSEMSLSLRNSPSGAKDSEVYTHLRLEMAW